MQKPTSFRAWALVGLLVVLFVLWVLPGDGQRTQASAVAKPEDLGPSARYVCKDFITRSGYNVPEFGAWHDWTTVQNGDGTWSVGAQLMAAAPGAAMRNIYLTCVMSNTGDNWKLVKLSRGR